GLVERDVAALTQRRVFVAQPQDPLVDAQHRGRVRALALHVARRGRRGDREPRLGAGVETRIGAGRPLHRRALAVATLLPRPSLDTDGIAHVFLALGVVV